MSEVELVSAVLAAGLCLPMLWILSRQTEGRPRRNLTVKLGIALLVLPGLAAVYVVGFGSARDVSAASAPSLPAPEPWEVESLPWGMRLEGSWQDAEGHGFRFELVADSRYRVLESSSGGQVLARGRARLDGRTLDVFMERCPRHWDGAVLHAARPSWTGRLYLDRDSITGQTTSPADATPASSGELGTRDFALQRVD